MLRKSLLLFALLVLALAASLASAQEDTFSLTIMHTNDTHAGHEPQSNGNGGVARQAAVVAQVRAESDSVLLLDAGDRFSGTLFHTTYLGQDQVPIMNALRYDVMTLGNHEFDNGDQVLADFVAGLNFPVVVANVDFSASDILADKFVPSVVVDVNGQQVGVIGLITADTVFSSSPGDELVFTDDYAGVANAAAADLIAQGVNKIILLTHTGINIDTSFIEQLEGVDVVIGGHSHTLLGNAYTAATAAYPLRFNSAAGEPVVYAQAGANNIYLGRLDLVFDAAGLITNAGGDTILLSRFITPDAEMAAIIEDLSGPVQELRNTPIGATAEDLLNGDRLYCRVEECAMGNIVADALRWETGAQIALMNGGGIRASIEAGEITLGEVLTVHPFGNQVATFQISGADVVAALENGVSQLQVVDGAVSRDGLAGRFPQVSGMRYTVDPTLEPGSRIVSVEVQGEDGTYAPIDPEAIYSVVTINFVRTGGDEYTVFAENAINPYDFGRLDYEVTGEYLKTISPIPPFVPEGRIVYVNAQPAPVE